MDVMNALRVIGPLGVFVGLSGMVSETRKVLALRQDMLGLNNEEALKASAWNCLLMKAPKKYHENDITYIPLDEAKSLSPEELAMKYELLPPISMEVRDRLIEVVS